MAAARHLILSCPPPLSGVYLVGNESRQGLDVGVAEFQCKSNLLTAGIYTCFLDSVKRRFQVPAEMALTPCASEKCHRVPQDILFIFSKKQSRWGCLPHTKALHRTCCVHVWEFCLVCVRARLGNCHANRDHPATIATFFCYLFFARKKKSNLIWWHSTGFWCDTKEIFFVFFFLRRRRPLYSFCLLLLLWSIGGGRRKRRRALRKACHIVSLGHGRLRSTAWR